MFFQGLFRILKWILTGDARVIPAEKHDTRPEKILLRLMAVVAAVLGLVALIVLMSHYGHHIGFLLEAAEVLFVPGIVVLIILLLVGLLVGSLLQQFIRRLGGFPAGGSEVDPHPTPPSPSR